MPTPTDEGPALLRILVPSRTSDRVYSVWTNGHQAVCNCVGAVTHGACYHERTVLALEESQALALREDLAPIPVRIQRSLVPRYDELKSYAMLARNVPKAEGTEVPRGLTPVGAFVRMVKGWELGVGPMTALAHIYTVNGRSEPDAQLMMGICLAKDPSCEFLWGDIDSNVAEVELWRGGRPRGKFKYTREDAEQAGQMARPKKRVYNNAHPNDRTFREEEYDGPWQQRTALMLAYNAARLACKLGAPDLINAVTAGPLGQYMDAATFDEFDEGDRMDSIDAELEIAGELPGPAPKDDGRKKTSPPPRRQSNGADAPVRAAESRQAVLDELKAEMRRQAPQEAARQALGVALNTLVGGGSVGDVMGYMSANNLTVKQVIERARASISGGDITEPAAEGEARELPMPLDEAPPMEDPPWE